MGFVISKQLSFSKAKQYAIETGIYPSRIETAEELQSRFAEIMWDQHGNKARDKWVKQAFYAFSHLSPSNNEIWTEESLKSYIHTVFPEVEEDGREDVKNMFEDAVPVFYQAMVNLGKYPYHNVHVGVEDDYLNLQTFSTALGLLTGGEYKLHARFGRYLRTSDPKYIQQVEYIRARDRRLLFQALSSPPVIEKELPADSNHEARNEKDDADLVDAMDIVQQRNNCHSDEFPKLLISGPPLPPASHFPSSLSQRLDGVIEKENLKKVVRMFLVLRMCEWQRNSQTLQNHLVEIERVTEVITNAMTEGQDGQYSIRWEGFNDAWEMYFPELPPTLSPLFKPATKCPGMCTFIHSTNDWPSTLTLLRQKIRPSHSSPVSTSSVHLLKLPIFTQIRREWFLQNFAHHPYSITACGVAAFLQGFKKLPNPSLVLFSAKKRTNHHEALNDLILGIFISTPSPQSLGPGNYRIVTHKSGIFLSAQLWYPDNTSPPPQVSVSSASTELDIQFRTARGEMVRLHLSSDGRGQFEIEVPPLAKMSKKEKWISEVRNELQESWREKLDVENVEIVQWEREKLDVESVEIVQGVRKHREEKKRGE